MRLSTALAILAAAAAAAMTAQQVPERPGGYREEARVERVVVDAYVTGSDGEPIPYLTAADFRLEVDGRRVPIESAEWVPADLPEVPPLLPLPYGPAPESFEPQAPGDPYPPGRLLIFFFQTNFVPSRLIGFVRMARQAHRFVETLLPTDRVAVLSFDSHLKLRQDFTGDRAKIDAAIDQAIRTGPPPPPDPGASPSLARHFDFYGAKKTVTPERSLLLIARAVQSIPGAKSMLYFGWGLGTIGGLGGPIATEQRDYFAAMRRIAAARINIFTLDVSDADYHSLEGSLRVVADATGGLYQKTHIFPRLAMDRVRRAISGRYVLVFRAPEGPRGFHSIGVELVGRKGRVTARTYYED
ncbi:MAG: VWA domain-containing protein [Thermoanaerobaculia bacterium]